MKLPKLNLGFRTPREARDQVSRQFDAVGTALAAIPGFREVARPTLTRPVRYVQIPDGRGGFFTFESIT